MHLDPDELALLARFFAKRFPHPAERAPILARAGLADSDADRPRDAWRDILRRAVEQQALAGLARALPDDDPDDANLREVRELLVGAARTQWSMRAAAAGAAAAAVLVLGVGGMIAVGTSLSRSSVAAPLLVDAEPAGEAVEAPSDEPSEADAAPAAEPVRGASAAEDDPPTDPPPAAAAGPTDDDAVASTSGDAPAAGESSTSGDAPAAGESSTSGGAENPAGTAEGDVGERVVTSAHCLKKDPSVRGYWYAGEDLPGQPGDVIEIPYDVNVRAEYPNYRNEYTTESAIRCVLYEGDRVKLSEAPISVPVDTFWVEITGADVLPRGG